MLPQQRRGSRASSRVSKPVQPVNANPENFEEEASDSDGAPRRGLLNDSDDDASSGSDSDSDDETPLNAVKAKQAKAAASSSANSKKSSGPKAKSKAAAAHLDPRRRQEPVDARERPRHPSHCHGLQHQRASCLQAPLRRNHGSLPCRKSVGTSSTK